MKTKSYLEFRLAGSTGKTLQWAVISTAAGDHLATIRWHGPWRKYVIFVPQRNGETLFDANCLREITVFLDEQNAAHKTLLAERKAQA